VAEEQQELPFDESSLPFWCEVENGRMERHT
jgi:hypothetical protein